MPARSQVVFTVGESGSGKSLIRCAVFLSEEFLREEQGIHYSNFPVNFEGFGKELGWDVEKVRQRIQVIPAAEMKLWADGLSGPWAYFKDKELSGAHIAIDEAHRYAGKHHRADHIAKWMDFCGGLRHSGATIEFLSQNHSKIPPEIKNEAGQKIEIIASAHRREMVTGMRWYDILQVVSKLRGKQIGLSIEQRYVSGTSGKNGVWRCEQTLFHWWRDRYFRLYDSYNVLDHEGDGDGQGAEKRRPKEPWERFGWFRLLISIYARNFIPVSIRVGAVALVAWLFMLGGLEGMVYGTMTGVMNATAKLGQKYEKDGKGEKPKAFPDRTGRVPGEPEPTPAPLPDDYRFPRKAGVSQRAELAEHEAGVMQAELARMVSYVQSLTSLVAVTETQAIFADGSAVRVGEQVPSGEWAGKVVKSINPRRGLVELKDGPSLRLGVVPVRRRVPPVEPAASTESGNAGPVDSVRIGTGLPGRPPVPSIEQLRKEADERAASFREVRPNAVPSVPGVGVGGERKIDDRQPRPGRVDGVR